MRSILIAVAAQLIAAAFHLWNARRCHREWARIRLLNQLVWAYSKELIERGVTLPPRCVMCCQILPRHVDGCMMTGEYDRQSVALGRIKYYPKGEHPPHPVEEEPPPHA